MADQEKTTAAADARKQAHPGLTEDLALALLHTPDLATDTIEQLSQSVLMKNRKVRLAIVSHPKAPRHISLPALRHLFTFELMQVALTSRIAADIKRAAEEVLIGRLESIPSGSRLTLARRASGRVAGELLLDTEPRVLKAALENARLTEAILTKVLNRTGVPARLVETVSRHRKWSNRRDVRIALLRSEHIPLARALEFSQSLPPALLTEVLNSSRLPANLKNPLETGAKP
jgi:hypothetical protein